MPVYTKSLPMRWSNKNKTFQTLIHIALFFIGAKSNCTIFSVEFIEADFNRRYKTLVHVCKFKYSLNGQLFLVAKWQRFEKSYLAILLKSYIIFLMFLSNRIFKTLLLQFRLKLRRIRCTILKNIRGLSKKVVYFLNSKKS